MLNLRYDDEMPLVVRRKSPWKWKGTRHTRGPEVVWVPGAFKLEHLQPVEPILFWNFSNFFTFILGSQFLLPQNANNGSWENYQNSQYGWDWGVSVPRAFKLDHLQPFKPIWFWNFSCFFTFILGSQFLLPQRANNGKREILATSNLDETEGFQCLGHSNWTTCSPLSQFCSEIFPLFSLSYWGPILFTPDNGKWEKGFTQKTDEIFWGIQIWPAWFRWKRFQTFYPAGVIDVWCINLRPRSALNRARLRRVRPVRRPFLRSGIVWIKGSVAIWKKFRDLFYAQTKLGGLSERKVTRSNFNLDQESTHHPEHMKREGNSVDLGLLEGHVVIFLRAVNTQEFYIVTNETTTSWWRTWLLPLPRDRSR